MGKGEGRTERKEKGGRGRRICYIVDRVCGYGRECLEKENLLTECVRGKRREKRKLELIDVSIH